MALDVLPSGRRLRSSENAAHRRAQGYRKPPGGLRFPPYWRRLSCAVLCCAVLCGVCGVFLCVFLAPAVPLRKRGPTIKEWWEQQKQQTEHEKQREHLPNIGFQN